MSLKTFLAAAAMCAAGLSPAFADSVPQLTGQWKGKIVSGFAQGATTHAKPGKEPRNLALEDTVWTLDVKKQEGSGFMGTWSTAHRSETVLGAIRADNKSIILSDEDSYSTATVLNDKQIEMCLQETGSAIIAVCLLLEKQ